jgi:hexosaminidase
VVALAVLATPAAAAATASRPTTVPALREWTAGAGTLRLGSHARIVLRSADSRTLRATAATLVADLGGRLRIVTGHTHRGDVLLALGASDPELGDEGYRLRIARTVRITANTTAGVFEGTRTLLQLLHQSPALPQGTARDWPRYPERGLMVDVGRKYFTLGWLENEVRQLAYLKLNYLHLHLSDDQGWRIESDTHPEIVSAQHLTKADIRQLLAVAARYHVTVIPEIDMPGHLGAALASHPELALRDVLGDRDSSALDYTLPAARRFVQDLLDEYLPLFPGPYWHMGADEYPVALVPALVGTIPYPQLQAYGQRQYGAAANSQDAYVSFVNWVDGIVRAHGKTLRIWNDGVAEANVARVNPDVVVEWWNNPSGPLTGPGPQELVDQGHEVLNAGYLPTYYVAGSGASSFPPRPDVTWMYENWQPNRFYGAYYLDGGRVAPPPFTLSASEPRQLGATLNEWNDNPDAETEAQIAANIAPRLRVLAQKTWGSAPLTSSYAEFSRFPVGP